jgi:peptidoglycan/LPS O-acetylase OafA/YrhL
MPLIRTDIQALRGIAVLMVILYHTRIGSVDAGYLGVDVFFVISGFLITGMVAGGIDRNDFRLGEFYFRRAKRLLPAAYVTVLITALLAPWFLDQEEMHNFVLQVIGTISFTANIVLWQQTGYFDGASDLKPLLHVWSLSLEEQYYMLLPATLLFIPKSRWLIAIVVAFVLSLVLCAVGGMIKPIATFYLLPTRAWELLIGSIGAIYLTRHASPDAVASMRAVRLLFYPSLVALFLLAFFPMGETHPGVGALLICIATLVLILRQHERLAEATITKGLARIGDFSYSLYLVHWPIIALLNNAWVGSDTGLPLSLRAFALALAFATAYPLYRFIERPVHRARFRYSPSLLGKTAVASVLLVSIAPTAIYATHKSVDFQQVRRVNQGFGEACEYVTLFERKEECSSPGVAKVLVWGDSYAMHLVAGLLQQAETGGVIQATRSVCGPVLNLGPERLINPEPGPAYDRTWAESCIDFNQSVVDFLGREKSVQTVVLSSPLTQYIDDENWVHVMKTAEGFDVVKPSIENTAAALIATADALRAVGKRVVVFSPPPTGAFNAGACLERQITGLVSLGGYPGCALPASVFQKKRAREIALLDSIEKAGVPVVRFSDFLCENATCRTFMDGTVLYRDQGHLTYDGARYLATRMNWAKLIDERAN